MFSSLFNSLARHLDPNLYEEGRVEHIRSFLEAKALTCDRCNSLALPIYGTTNRYRCTKCGRQFVSNSHGLPHCLRQMQVFYVNEKHTKKWYDEAVQKF